jgi:hypothetical protein
MIQRCEIENSERDCLRYNHEVKLMNWIFFLSSLIGSMDDSR